MTLKLTASLVLFHNDPNQYGVAIQSYLDGSEGELFVVDNSKSPQHHELFAHPRVRYWFAGQNLGFGAAHNRALANVGAQSDVHLFLNPDISFGSDVLPMLLRRLVEDKGIGALMPQIVYPNGDLQRLCKSLPTPLDLIFRRFIPINALRNQINQRYELHQLRHDRLSEVPSLSGCFLLARTEILKRIGGFDERFFMYLEDVDLVRRIGAFGSTMYDPSVLVSHDYAKGSYRNKRMLIYHLRSAVQYFNKWGWFFDAERRRRNNRILKLLQQ